MSTAETPQEAATPHKHGFPCNPPGGTFWSPGPCECGKTYLQNEADTMLTEALKAVAVAYGVPPRVSTRWAVAHGSENLNDGSGFVAEYNDGEDAREHVSSYDGGSVVKRTVIALLWETVPGEEPAP